jgi:hypothetical protein
MENMLCHSEYIFMFGFYVTEIKYKAVPLHAMVAHWGRGGIAPTHS